MTCRDEIKPRGLHGAELTQANHLQMHHQSYLADQDLFCTELLCSLQNESKATKKTFTHTNIKRLFMWFLICFKFDQITNIT